MQDALRHHAEVLDVADLGLPQCVFWMLAKKRPQLAVDACSIWDSTLPDAVRRSVVARRYEYIVGRLAASELLQAHGLPPHWLASTAGRPAWPAGVTGSISHSQQLVLVALGPTASGLRSLGVDIEQVEQTTEMINSLRHCFDVDEASLLGAVHNGAIVGFSLKEALYKAVNPLTGVFFDFRDASIIALDAVRGIVTLRLDRDIGDGFAAGATFHGVFRFFRDHVISHVAIAAGQPEPFPCDRHDSGANSAGA